MKRIAKITSLFLIMALIMQQGVFAADDAAAENAEYSREYKFMSALSMLYAGSKNQNSTLTRAEFASWILSVMGVTEQKAASAAEGNNFDSAEYDKNGDWIWKSAEELSEEEILDTATPFRDVSTEHPLWDDIRLAAQLGIMSGSDERFRPDEAITGYEIIKVFVEACGAKVMTKGDYPMGYVMQANQLGITDGVAGETGDWPVSYKTALRLVYNALHAEVYTLNGSGSDGRISMEKKDDYTLLEYWKGIKYIDGTVTRNKYTGLTDTSGINAVEVDKTVFDCTGISADDFLGMKVRVYYTGDDDDTTAVYIEKSDSNKEITISFDDVTGYVYPNLKYTDNNRDKQLYIGTETNVIYNGKALLDYDDSIFDTQYVDGNIRFLDANGDGKYETVFINKAELFWIDSIDYQNKIVYDKLSSADSTLSDALKTRSRAVDLSEGDTEIFDNAGNALSVDNIFKDGVLSVRRTLPAQGSELITVIFSMATVEGKIEKTDSGDKTITLNGKEYETADFVDFSKFQAGESGIFYLTDTGLIAAAENKAETASIGWLIKIPCVDEGMGIECRVKLYSVSEEEIKTYGFPEKVTYNKKRIKSEKIPEQPEIYDSAKGKAIPQPIKYKVDSDGNICELMTANVIEDEFCAKYVETGYGYRSFGMLYQEKPEFYFRTGAKLINVPMDDSDDERNYFRVSFDQNNWQTVSIVCLDSADSYYATAMFVRTTNASKMSDSTSVSMVSNISYCIDDNNDFIWSLTLRNTGGSVSANVYDTDLFGICEDLEKGDLVRAEYGGKVWQIKRLEKVFDAGTLQLTDGINPVNSFSSVCFYMHGSVCETYESGKIVGVIPYLYSGKGSDITKTLAENTPANIYPINAEKYTIIVFNKKRSIIEEGSYLTDIVPGDEENNIVICGQWGDPNGMFIYR